MNTEKEIVIFTSEDGKISLDVQMDDETVWLSQNQMVELFERDQSVVSRHISNAFKEELDKKAICIFCILLIQISLSLFKLIGSDPRS